MTTFELRDVFFLSNGMRVLKAKPEVEFDDLIKDVSAMIRRDGDDVCAVQIQSEMMELGREGEHNLITYDDLPFTRADLEEGLWTVVLGDRAASAGSGSHH